MKFPIYISSHSTFSRNQTLSTDCKVYGGLSPVSSDESSKNFRKQSISLEDESHVGLFVCLFVCLFVYVFPAKLLYYSFGHVFCAIKKSFLPPFYGAQSFISMFKSL
jgi:hypothetical protein